MTQRAQAQKRLGLSICQKSPPVRLFPKCGSPGIGRGGVQGEGDQGGEEVGLGLYLELTAAGLDKAGGNGQAQPAAAVGTALVPPDEALGVVQAGTEFCGRGVAQGGHRLSLLHREGQVHPGTGQGVFQGVAQQILEHPVEAVTVPLDEHRVVGELGAQLQPALLDGLVHIRQGLAEQAGQKADRSAVDSLSNVVEQKADKTALSAAEGRISALESGKADKTELAAQIRALSQSHEADTAALRSENCWVRLGEWSLTEESSLISLSFPEIDKSRFRQLRLHFHICGVSALGNVILRMNQVSSGQYDTGGINRTDGLYLSFTNSLFAAGFAEWFFIPGAADRLPCHVWYCSKAVMNGSDSAALVGADWESLSSVQFVPKDGTLCAPGSEFALYGLKR